MLYFLDFEHYKVTGRSVTGLQYSAWKMGPVPTKLFDELESPEPDMAEALTISQIPVNHGNLMLLLKPLKEFSLELFSKRELNLLKKLASEYKKTKSDDMIEATHLENMPWDKVYNKESSPQSEIPYAYALQPNEREEMMRIIHERESMIGAIG